MENRKFKAAKSKAIGEGMNVVCLGLGKEPFARIQASEGGCKENDLISRKENLKNAEKI